MLFFTVNVVVEFFLSSLGMFDYPHFCFLVLNFVQFIMYPNSVDAFPYGQQTGKFIF